MSVRNLSAGYNGDRAVRDISFDVLEGERIGIIGPNGAGKSTLFKAIVGLLSHQGEISIHGAPCSRSHTMVGYVPQYEAIDLAFPGHGLGCGDDGPRPADRADFAAAQTR